MINALVCLFSSLSVCANGMVQDPNGIVHFLFIDLGARVMLAGILLVDVCRRSYDDIRQWGPHILAAECTQNGTVTEQKLFEPH